jgi:poly-gamma-glutamate synthesis protein (capsule biosynthesis protein)
VAFVHWGENYAGVTDAQREAARRFAEAGYDLVIGHHPHVAQEVEIVDGMPVLYSLGNLAFGTPGRFDRGEGYGLIARTAFGGDGSIDVRLTCIVTDNEQVSFQPEPCTAAEAEGLFGRLGPHLHMDGRDAVLDRSD